MLIMQKSPCLTKNDGLPCHLKDEDKNNDECRNCMDRLKYVAGLDKSPSASMPLPVQKQKEEEVGIKVKNIKDIPKHKVCSRKDCPFQGEPQPINSFDNHSQTKDGKSPRCKTCRRILQNKTYNRKKLKAGKLTLDFNRHEDTDLLNRVIKAAEDEKWSVEAHLLYWIGVLWK